MDTTPGGSPKPLKQLGSGSSPSCPCASKAKQSQQSIAAPLQCLFIVQQRIAVHGSCQVFDCCDICGARVDCRARVDGIFKTLAVMCTASMV